MSEKQRWLTKDERWNLIAQHPGVTRLKHPTGCEGYVASGFSFKRQREGRLPRCHKSAWWSFQPLRDPFRRVGGGRTAAGRTPRPGKQHYCWQHLIYRGIYGSMEEEARTNRFLRRVGYSHAGEVVEERDRKEERS
jgi:hypothetical protein